MGLSFLFSFTLWSKSLHYKSEISDSHCKQCTHLLYSFLNINTSSVSYRHSQNTGVSHSNIYSQHHSTDVGLTGLCRLWVEAVVTVTTFSWQEDKSCSHTSANISGTSQIWKTLKCPKSHPKIKMQGSRHTTGHSLCDKVSEMKN